MNPKGRHYPADEKSTIDEQYTKKLAEIHVALPDSTPAERQRFLADRDGNVDAAIQKLKHYLHWREQHCGDDLKHVDSWTYASQLAVKKSASTKGGAKKSKTKNDIDLVKLPCTLFMLEYVNSTSDESTSTDAIIKTKKYLQHLPARIDTKLAETSVYALALAIYLDHALDRNSTEKVTLVIDVRSGFGWANIKAIHLLPFIQSTVRLLCDLHPMRLEQCIIYPVPMVANVIWKAVKPFVGKENDEKVCIVSGPAGKNDNPPKKLSQYMDVELISKLEQRRKSCFSTSI